MKRFDTINVIPLIDVILVLLAIVLMTASFIVKDSLDIQLPETQNSQSYTPPTDLPVIHLAINEQNQYFLDEKPLNLAEIEQQLALLPKEQSITLSVDQKTDFGRFVQIIDLLKGLNLQNLTVLTESKTS